VPISDVEGSYLIESSLKKMEDYFSTSEPFPAWIQEPFIVETEPSPESLQYGGFMFVQRGLDIKINKDSTYL